MTEMAFFHYSNFMLQTPHDEDDADHDHNHPSTSLSPFPPSNCTPQQFHGVTTSTSLLAGTKRSSMSFDNIGCGGEDHHHMMNNNNNHGCEDELSDDEGSQLAGEKKRRLNSEQVRTLEKNFELGNKLEPERKMQLAQALGLQPRQIAIWFQNRRARWKTKQLEKDYDVLKRQFEAVKAENDALQAQNQKLHAEIVAMKTREPTESINLNKETDQGSCSNRSDQNSSEIKLDINSTTTPAAIDSPLSAEMIRPLFPPLATTARPGPVNGVAQQLFSKSETQIPKMDQSNNIVKEELGLCNMFCGMDDQTGFWPWLEHHQFN